MFVGSQRVGKVMAIAFTLIEAAKLNVTDPQDWLTDVLAVSLITKSIKLTHYYHGIILMPSDHRGAYIPTVIRLIGDKLTTR